MARLIGSISFLCLLSAQAQTRAPQSPQPSNLTAQDLTRGKQLFEAQCAPCHGIQGTGGKGANLARPTLKHAADDAGLFAVIQNGIENTGMPRAWQMTDREVWLVVAHVRSLGRVAVENLPGDAAQGKALFRSQGCGACHIVNGVGGNLGPELTEVGARRSSERLRQCLLEPGKALPDGFVMVRAVRGDGSALEGIRVNEDSFTIQLRDLANRFHSLRKQQLQTLEYKLEATPMSSYRDKLSGAEVDHLVAYLASLRGQR
ncbi:MAG TPA: c-type cytochrome [Bryobacteraceae bacterium]|nr:c-type cytochrome [Bryobacteraceae bacterium]